MTKYVKKLSWLVLTSALLLWGTFAQNISINETSSEEYKISDCWNVSQGVSFTVETDETIDLTGLIVSITGDDEIIKHIQLVEHWENSLQPSTYHWWTPLRDWTATVSTLSDSSSLQQDQLFSLTLQKKTLKKWIARTFELIPVVWCDTSAIYSINVIGVIDNGTIRLEQENDEKVITFQQEMTITPTKGNDLIVQEITFDDELRIATATVCFETSQPLENFENWISSVIKIVNTSRWTRLEVPYIWSTETYEECLSNEISYADLWIDQQHQNNTFHLYGNQEWSYGLREDDMRNNFLDIDYKASVDYSLKKPTVERKEVDSFPNPKIAFELCNISFDTPLINPWGEVHATIKNKTNNREFHTTARYNDVLKKDDCIYFRAHRKDLWIRNKGIYLINVIIEDTQFLGQFNEIPIFRPKIDVEKWEEYMIETHSELQFWRVLISDEDVTATICNNWWVPITNKNISLRFNKDSNIEEGDILLENHEHTEKISLKSKTCRDVVVPLEELPEAFFENNPNKELKIWIFSSYNDIQEYYYWDNSTIVDVEIDEKKKKPHSDREFCRYSNCPAYVSRIESMKSSLVQSEKQQLIRTVQYLISNLANDDKKDILLFLLEYLN